MSEQVLDEIKGRTIFVFAKPCGCVDAVAHETVGGVELLEMMSDYLGEGGSVRTVSREEFVEYVHPIFMAGCEHVRGEGGAGGEPE